MELSHPATPRPRHVCRWLVMNDPNGPFVDPRTGLFHLFAQFRYTNSSFVPTTTQWLHAVSKDGLRWDHLPVALKPDQPYDCGGVFTGSATLVGSPPRPVLAYSVACNAAINLAVPANTSDPNLVDWVKPATNPAITHAQHWNFRDPTTAWKPPAAAAAASAASAEGGRRGGGDGDEWRLAVGCSGHLCTFRSKDFASWRDAGMFYRVPGQHMWECPDVFSIPGTDA